MPATASPLSVQVPHLKFLIKLSVPSILACLLDPLASLIDTLYLGQLGIRHMAALAVASSVFNSLTWIFSFLAHVSTQAISFRIGAQQHLQAINLFKISLLLALVLGIASSSLLSLLSSALLNLAGSTPETEGLLKEYFFIRLWGQPLVLMGLVVIGALRAYQKVNQVLIIGAITLLSNALLTGLLLFVWPWGMKGAAIGTVFSYAILLTLGFWQLGRAQGFWPQFLRAKIGHGEWFVFSKNSLNFFGRSAVLTLVFFSSTKIASQFGTHILAAHHILLQFWLFSSFFIDGLAVTATLLGAQYLGEGKILALKQMIRHISLASLALGVCFLILYAAIGPSLWPLFSQNPALWATLNLFWPLIWASQPLNALAFIADGILFGMESFQYLRQQMWRGHLLTYWPLAILAIFAHNYALLLWGLILLNGYRVTFGYLKIKGVLKKL